MRLTFMDHGLKVKDDPLLAQSLYSGLPKAEVDSSLDAVLSSEELYAAVQGLQRGKDGLPADLYKVFWSVIASDVLAVLRDRVWLVGSYL